MCDYFESALAASPKFWGCTTCSRTLEKGGEICYICGKRFCSDCIEVRNTRPNESPHPSEEVICKECHKEQYLRADQALHAITHHRPDDSDVFSIISLSPGSLTRNNSEDSIAPVFKREILSPDNVRISPLRRKAIPPKPKKPTIVKLPPPLRKGGTTLRESESQILNDVEPRVCRESTPSHGEDTKIGTSSTEDTGDSLCLSVEINKTPVLDNGIQADEAPVYLDLIRKYSTILLLIINAICVVLFVSWIVKGIKL